VIGAARAAVTSTNAPAVERQANNFNFMRPSTWHKLQTL
jgi:hypothetical protein